jgi:hypothetical protein
MNDLWPRNGLDPLEYVVGLRSRFSYQDAGHLFDLAYKLLGVANRTKGDLPEASAAMMLLGGWLNSISIAMQRGPVATEAFELSTMYEGVIVDLLGMPHAATT